jgi:non-ribosomal peptide synthetase component E (peptide arylation enzyme)
MQPTRFTQDMIGEFVTKGYWDTTDLISTLETVVFRNADKESLADSTGKRMTWRQLDQLSDRLAVALLRFGLEKDDVAVAQLPTTVENILIRISLLKAGIVGAFPALTYKGEIETILLRADAAAFVGIVNDNFDTLRRVLASKKRFPRLKGIFFVGESQIQGALSLNELVNSVPEAMVNSEPHAQLLQKSKCSFSETAFLALTSGTTGTPKFCEWPVGAIKLYAQTVTERMKISTEDTIGIIAPLSGAPGITPWLAALYLGARTVLLEKFDAQSALRLIEREKITVAGVVPTQLIKMLNHPDLGRHDLSSLRAVRVGGAPIAPDVAEQVEKKMGCKVVRAAGASESMTIGHTRVDDPDAIRLGTVGKPWNYNEVKIVDMNGKQLPTGEAGEIWVRGPCTGSGYFRDVPETIKAWGALGREGWYRTGDLGNVDKDGNIRITGRIKNMILRGGQNIYPEEVEAILALHPKVLEVVVVPMADPEMGEKACAFVALRKKGDAFSFQEMIGFLRQKNIASFKIPERLEIMDALPTVGEESKVDRKALAERLR